MKIFFAILLTLPILQMQAQKVDSVNVQFDFDRFTITALVKEQLKNFVKDIQVFPSSKIEIHGYCDSIGTTSYNDQLSLRRVEAVYNFLVYQGIQDSSIVIQQGHGERNPLNENSSKNERRANRRVELFASVINNRKQSDIDKNLIDSNKQINANTIIEIKQSEIPPTQNDNSKTSEIILTIGKIIADSSKNSIDKIVLKNINFIGGQSIFTEDSKPALEELLLAMKTYPKLVIRVEGHICCIPKYPYDKNSIDLSVARAKAVQDFLINNGINAQRISHKGFGQSRPIYPIPEKSEKERHDNRRVEISISFL